MSFKPMKPQDIDVSGVEVTGLKKLDNGANVAYVNYNGKPIYITTPELEVPFDSQWWPSSEGDSSGKWSMKANLRGEDCAHLISLFQTMDKFLKENAMTNSVAWFKKRNLSEDTIDTLYTPMLKEDIDPESGEPTGKYPPSLSFKIVKREGKVNCKVFGEGKKEFNVQNESEEEYIKIEDLVKKGSKVKLLLRCNGLWVANGKFGCTWRAEQMKVVRAATFDDCVFDSDEEEEVEKIDQNFVDTESEEESEASEEEVKTTSKKPRKVNKK